MGLLSAEMLAEMQKASPDLYSLCEITFPSGIRRYAKAGGGGVSSATQGYYENKVKRFGTVARAIPDRQMAFRDVSPGIVLADEDMDFSNLVGTGEQLQDSPVTMRICSPNVAFANWYTGFSGRLYEWTQSNRFEWSLTFRPNDLPLLSPFMKASVTRYDWPNADAATLGLPYPILYGLNISYGAGSGEGAVPTLYVDTSGFRYLVALGWVSVSRVFAAGVLVSSGYSITHVTVNGRDFTLIDFTTDQGTTKITCDATGYETVGDGTGTTITTPADQLLHFLTNFVWNEYQSGLWFSPGTAPLDTASFTTLNTFLQYRAGGCAYRGSNYIADRRTGKQVLDDWMQHQIAAYWLPNGNLAVKADDPTTAPYTATDSHWLRYGRDDPSHSLRCTFQVQDCVRRVVSQSNYDRAAGNYRRNLEAFDSSVASDETDTLAIPWGETLE